jgi:nucleoside-diphosphate-sugar epimerase
MTPGKVPLSVVVTGGTGFLGSRVVHSLLDNGHRIVVLKRSHSALTRLEDILDMVEFYDVDGESSPNVFEALGPIDAVVHTATNYCREGVSAGEALQINVLWPLQLLESAESNNVKLFINTDSFFNTPDLRYRHLPFYALSKQQFSEWGRQIADRGRIRFVNLRLEHMYGPGEDRSKFSSFIVDECLSNRPEIRLTPAVQCRDFIYVDDVVSAYLSLINYRASLPTGFIQCGVGTGDAVPLRDFVEMIHRFSQSISILNFGVLPLRDGEVMYSCADTALLRSLGWRSKTTLEEGVKKMVTFAKGEIAAR